VRGLTYCASSGCRAWRMVADASRAIGTVFNSVEVRIVQAVWSENAKCAGIISWRMNLRETGQSRSGGMGQGGLAVSG